MADAIMTMVEARPMAPDAVLRTRNNFTLAKAVLPGGLFLLVPVNQAVGPIFDYTLNPATPVHTGIDGKKYFVPTVRIARRSKTSPAYDVTFDKRPDGTFLVVGLELLRGTAPVDAEVFSIDQLSLTVMGAEAVPLAFQIDDRPPVGEAVRSLQCAALIPEAQVGVLVGLMQTRSDLWFRLSGRILSQQRFIEQAPRPGGTGGSIVLTNDRLVARPVTIVNRPTIVMGGRVNIANVQAFDARAAGTAVSQMQFVRAVDLQSNSELVALKYNKYWRDVAPAATGTTTRFEQRQVVHSFSSPQTTPAFFPPSIAVNRVIYFEVATGFDGAFGVSWRTDGDFGDLREAPRGGQYYVLPDSFGLAFDRASGLPAVSALLIATAPPGGQAAREYKVRVRFGMVPVIDQLRIQRLRQFMREREGLPFAEVAIGGFDSATFDCFPILQMLGVDEVGVPAADRVRAVDAKSGFNLTIDLTIEQYTLLVQLLKTSEHQAGAVRFTLSGENDIKLTRDVPVRLSVTRPAEMPLDIALKQDTPNEPPHEITVSNAADCEVKVASLVPTLIATIDERAVEAYAASATPATLTISPKGNALVTLTPKDSDPMPVWNSLAVALSGVTASFNPEMVFSRIHQLAGTTKLPSRVTVSSWMLADPSRIPSALANVLFGLDVQLRRHETEEPATLTLVIGGAAKVFDFAFGLGDVTAGETPDFPLFEYRQRNRLGTGDGPWTPWARFRGNELLLNPEIPK